MKKTKEYLYEKFETGDKPSQQDFYDLIDSTYNESAVIAPIKILFIGNSFSDALVNHFGAICASAKVDVVVGALYRPGESLQGHYEGIVSGATYTYVVHSASNGVPSKSTASQKTLLQGIKDNDWDYVFYQQSSGNSYTYSSFNPYLPNLITYVHSNAIKPTVKHGLHMTWAYSTSNLAGGPITQVQMYDGIVTAYKSALKDNYLDILIPSGTAIQNARSISDLQSLNNDMTTDGVHLGGGGEIVIGFTLFESLVSGIAKKDLFKDVTFKLDGYDYYVYLAKIAAKNASLNPFNVTDI